VQRAPATIELACAAAFLSLLIGLPIGIYTRLRARSMTPSSPWSARCSASRSRASCSASLLIMVFSVELRWLPSFGRGEVVQAGWWSTGC
jgi:peptide/nickel transport system permease protein